MGAIKLDAMGGMLPLVDDRQLPDNMAATCANVLVRSGALRPVISPIEVHRFVGGNYPTARRLRFNDGTSYWYPLTHVDGAIIKAPITNDTHERFYILDPPGSPMRFNTKTRIVAGSPSYLLGLPAPASAISVAATGGASTLNEVRAYVYTYVDIYGQESAPSSPAIATGKIDATSWTVSGMATSIPDAANRPAVTKKIYRTLVSEGGGTSYNFVAAVALEAASYVDSLSNTTVALNPQMETLNFVPPPANLSGVVNMPGGFLVGWEGRNLHFSEPFRPWAWPVEYDLSLVYQIVGAGVLQQTLVVATTGNPYTLTGNTPQAMTPSLIDRFEPCPARASVVGGVDAVFFASANGLIAVNAAGAVDLTDQIIGRDKWVLDYGLNIFGAARFGAYYMALNSPTDGTGFLIATNNAREAVVRLIDFRGATHLWSDSISDDIMMMVRQGLDSIVQRVTPRDSALLAAAARPFSWVSKEFFLPRPVNFGVLMVNAEGPPLGWSPQDEVDGAKGNLPSADPPTGQLSAADLHARAGATSKVGMMGVGRWGAYIAEAPDKGDIPPGAAPPGWLGWPWWPGVNAAEGRVLGFDLSLPAGVEGIVRVYANRRLVYREALQPNKQVRLPTGFRSSVWQIALTARIPVFSVHMASTPRELALV